MSMAPPRDGRGFTGMPGLDHDLVRRLDDKALARFDDIVVRVPPASDPHAAADDRKFTCQALDAHGGIEPQGGGTSFGQELRSHHESPV